MDFYVNGEKIDVTLEDEKKIGDILKSFEINCEQNNAAVIGIIINDVKITAENFDEYSEKDISDNLKIEFSIVTKQAIFDSFKKLSTLFSELAEEMEQIPVKLQTGKDKEANLSIKKLADNIDEFCHIATLASLFENFTDIEIDGKPFKDFFKEFSPILTEFEQMLEANDTVSIGDLAEYEICPRLMAISKTLEAI